MQDERLSREINYLVLKYLQQPGFEEAHRGFVQGFLNRKFQLPAVPRLSEPTEPRPPSLNAVERAHGRSIRPQSLLAILKEAKNVVNSGPSRGLLSILGGGDYSLQQLLRNTHDKDESYNIALNPVSNNLVYHLQRRQYGSGNIKHAIARRTAKSPTLIARILGHLAPIYCVIIDRTGTVAFTGSDDNLVKMWSLERYLLVGTLRGHKKEITDLSVNVANTMLASGSCDREIRVWCLQTSSTLAVLTGHRASITAIHFCPNDDYLVSSAGDGNVCFWPVTGPKTVSDDPVTFYERVRTADKLLSSSFSTGGSVLTIGSSDGDIFSYEIRGELGLPVKGPTLEGHTAMVITLVFAKRSLRLVSGSKDGTVRVWRRGAGSWDHVICNARSHLVPERDAKEQIDVLFVNWTCNESCVVASCSDTSIRMWNATSGALTRSFLGHDDDIYFVQQHPLLSSVLVSCGHDGHIISWSMETGCALNTFLNVIEGEGRASVLEAAFTPDGETLLTVDANGHISIFGDELVGRSVSVPREQFFNTDYFDLIRDRFSNVLDTQTELPPHQLGPPYLVDQQGCALAAEVQGQIPGRHFLSPSDIVLLKKRQKRKRYIDFMTKSLAGRAPPVPRARMFSGEQNRQEDGPTSNPELADFQRSFVQDPDTPPTDPDHIPTVLPPTSTYDLFDGLMARSVAMVNPRKSRELWLGRRIVPALSEYHLVLCAGARKKVTREEWALLKEVAVVNISSRNARHNARHSSGKQSPARSTRRARVVPLTVASSSSSEQGEESSRTSDSCGSDWVLAQMRQKRRKQPTRKEESPFTREVEEDTSGAESSSDDQNPPSYSGSNPPSDSGSNTPRTSSRKRRRTTRPIHSSSDEASEPTKQKRKKMISAAKQRILLSLSKASISKCTRASSPLVEETRPQIGAHEETLQIMEQHKPPAWITQIRPIRSPYLPQISDKIYYFVQGHKDYVNSEDSPPESMKVLPWEQVPGLEAVEPCQVLSLSFITGPPTLCQMRLGLLGSKGEVADTCQVVYHDAPNVPDFMVLKRHYEDSMAQRWMKGDKFRCLIDDAWWEGIVASESALDSAYEESPWKRFVVKWDIEPDLERLSPWDIEPLPKDTRSSKRRSPAKKHPSSHSGDAPSTSRQPFSLGGGNARGAEGPLDPYIISYYHTYGTWGEETRTQFKDRIGDALLQAMELREAQEFLYPVNFNDHPDYYTIIAYPVDLTTIHNRLTEDHYRSLDSVLWEIRQLEINARVYNEDDSKIVRDVTSLATRLLLFIRSPLLTHVTDVTEQMVTEELGKRGKNKKRKRQPRVKLENSTEWFLRAREIVTSLSDHPDSQPFFAPVDLSIYTDYLKYCQEPMDLERIADKLHGGSYGSEGEFYRDIELIFTNSKAYNTRSSSQVAKMTARMQKYYHKLIDEMASDTRHSPLPSTSLKKHIPNSPELQISSTSGAATRHSSRDSSKRRTANNTPQQCSSEDSSRKASSSDSGSSGKDSSPRSSKGKEPKRRRIYTSSTEDDEKGEPIQKKVAKKGVDKSSGGESEEGSEEGGSSSQSVSQVESPGGSSSQGRRSRRRRRQVAYEEIASSGEEAEEGSTTGDSGSKPRKVNGRRGNRNGRRGHRNGRRGNRNGRRGKSNGSKRNSRREPWEYGSERPSSEGSSDSASDAGTRVRRRGKPKKKQPVTTMRGRSVKKNVRYDDFF